MYHVHMYGLKDKHEIAEKYSYNARYTPILTGKIIISVFHKYNFFFSIVCTSKFQIYINIWNVYASFSLSLSFSLFLSLYISYILFLVSILFLSFFSFPSSSVLFLSLISRAFLFPLLPFLFSFLLFLLCWHINI